MKRLGLFLTLVTIAASASTMIATISSSEAAPFSKRGRIDRVKYYTQKYQQECKPQLLCTAECQDVYDFLRREGIDVGGPCAAH
jgi:hypothetical protein